MESQGADSVLVFGRALPSGYQGTSYDPTSAKHWQGDNEIGVQTNWMDNFDEFLHFQKGILKLVSAVSIYAFSSAERSNWSKWLKTGFEKEPD